ncbi:MAG: hypothetical protein ACYDHG_03620 [Desulfomonilaceae bacterium]
MKTFSGINTHAFKRMRFAIGKGMGGRVAAEKVGYIVYDYYEEMAGSPVLEEVRGEGDQTNADWMQIRARNCQETPRICRSVEPKR